MIPLGILASARHAAGSGRTVTYVPFQNSGTLKSAHTWTVATGAAGAGRSLVLGISAEHQGARYVTGATVDGNAATLDAVAPNSWHCSAMGRYALTASDTSVTVTATFSGNVIAVRVGSDGRGAHARGLVGVILGASRVAHCRRVAGRVGVLRVHDTRLSSRYHMVGRA